MIASDRIFGVVVMALAAFYVWSAISIEIPFFTDPFGPRNFPYMIGAVAFVSGLFVTLKPDPSAKWPGPVTWLKLAAALVVLIGYALTLRPYGFIIPTAIASGLLSFQIRPKILQAILVGLGLSVGLFFIFKFLLGLGLFAFPKGWFV